MEPSPDVLEALDPQAFPSGPDVMLLRSPHDSDGRAWQDAWRWAQLRDPLDLSPFAGLLDPRVVDPVGVLTDHEVWALAVRSRAGNAAALRPNGQAEVAGGSGRIARLVRRASMGRAVPTPRTL